MQKKRSIIQVLVILLLMAVLIVSGILSSHLPVFSSGGTTKIVVWHYYNGAQAVAFDNLVMEFNNTSGAKNGIIVEAVSKSSVDDLVNALTSSAQKDPGADELPNIFQCYLDTAVNLDEMGILASLDSYLTKEERAEYIDSYMDEGILGAEGSLKLFPVAKSTELMAVNKNEFEPFAKACGVTFDDLSTWEGIAETAEKYYDYTGGKSFFGRDAFANYMIVGSMQLGQEIFQVDKGEITVNLDKETMRKLWDNYYVPYIRGYYQHSGRFRSDDIKLGNIIAEVGSSTGMSYLPTEITDEDGITDEVSYQLLAAPVFKGGEPFAVQQGASMAVTQSTEQEEAASVLFLKWLTEEEHNIALSVSSCYLPVKKSANDMEKIDRYLSAEELKLSEFDYEAIKTAIGQVKDRELYTTKGFSAGYDARGLLDKSMIDAAIADREQILLAIASGMDEDEAAAPYLRDGCFEEWYETLCEQMNEICTE